MQIFAPTRLSPGNCARPPIGGHTFCRLDQWEGGSAKHRAALLGSVYACLAPPILLTSCLACPPLCKCLKHFREIDAQLVLDYL